MLLVLVRSLERVLKQGVLFLCIGALGLPALSQAERAFEARIAELLKPVPQQNEQEREATAQAMADLGLPAALDIGEAAKTATDDRREVAVRALQRMGPALIVELCENLSNDQEMTRRLDAAYVVGLLVRGDTPGMEPAFPLLLDIVVRYGASRTEALGALNTWVCKSDQVYLEVTRRFVNGDSIFRGVLDYTRCAPPEALHLLVDALASQEDYFRSGARELLEYHGEKARAVFPYLVEKLNAERYPGQLEVPLLLAKIGMGDAIPPLLNALTRSGEESLRGAAANALASLQEDAVPALASALAMDRFYAARALAAIGEPAEAALLEAGNGPDALARTGALYALGCMNVLSPTCREALEQALARAEMAEQCIAAMALAKHPAPESTLTRMKAAIDLAPSGSAVARVLTDCYFRLTLPAESELGEALPPYEVGKREVSSEVESEIVEEYWLRLEVQEPPIPLSIMKVYRDENWREGFDPNSLQLRVVQPGRLLEATWNTVVQGNGKYMAGSVLLLLRDEKGWREIFRHNGAGASGGMGSGGADYHTYQFCFSPVVGELWYRNIVEIWAQSNQPGAFYEWTGWTGWAGQYYAGYTTTSAWECAIEDGTLTFKPGVQTIEADGDFPRNHWSRLPEEALLRLNPHLEGRQFWTGEVYTASEVPAPVPDHTIYLRYPGTP